MIKTEEFTLFNGKLCLKQPQDGYRVAIDPIFLAAAVDRDRFDGANILDLGCGVGTVGFCLLARFPCHVTGVDVQKDYIDLAIENAKAVALEQSCSFFHKDVAQYRPGLAFDAVVSNPPYMAGGTMSQKKGKDLANKESISFDVWATTAAHSLNKGGHFYLIHRADRLHDILKTLQDKDFGSFQIFPLWPRAGRAAKRVIITARKQKYAPLTFHPGLVLHDGQAYTKTAGHILHDGHDLSINL